MPRIVLRPELARTLAEVTKVSFILILFSALVFGVAAFDSNYIYLFRAWNILIILCLLCLSGLILLGAIYVGIELIWLRSYTRSVLASVFAFVVLATVFVSIFFINQWLDNRIQKMQFDVVQAMCRKGFEDPSTLEQYNKHDAVLGQWNYISVWEDKSHNAIWVDSCDSLSSCGVVCIRDGRSLENGVTINGYYKFTFIQEGLYWWD